MDVERLRQFLVPHVLQIVRRHEQALRHRQPGHGLFEPVPQLQGAVRSLGRGSRAERLAIERNRDRSWNVPCLKADVDHDAIDPRGEARRSPEVGEAPVHPEKHVLREILRSFAIAHRPRDQTEHHPAVAGHELGEGVLAAVAAAGDELLVGDVGHSLPD
jgi:hypothetical protein